MTMPILLVDDDPDVIETVSMMLQEGDFSVTCVENGEDCVRAVESGFKGLVLLDVMMPKLNGWETIQKLVERKLNEQVVICMMTCVADPDTSADKVSQFVHGYIEKPFHSEDLISYVSQYKELLPK